MFKPTLGNMVRGEYQAADTPVRQSDDTQVSHLAASFQANARAKAHAASAKRPKRAADSYRLEFFEDNLARSNTHGRTREQILESVGRGRVVASSDGAPALRIDGRVLGRPSSDDELQRVVEASGANACFVVFGLGVGHTVRELRAFGVTRLLVFEPEPGAVRTLYEHGPCDVAHVRIVTDFHDLVRVWLAFSDGRSDATLVQTPGYDEVYPDALEELEEHIRQLVKRTYINDNTYRVRGRDWIRDILHNVEALAEHPPLVALKDEYQEVPAFIIGAGPSLNKNIALLGEAQKKGIVIAVNSSAPALAKHGVTPQILTCIESIDVSHIISSLPFIDSVVRAFSLSGAPAMLHTGQGPLLPVFEALPEITQSLTELTGYDGLSACCSVSTLAFSLAQRLGCSPIVLVGQDLAYTDGQAYAAGTPYEGSRVRVMAGGEYLEHDWADAVKSTHNSGDRRIHEREPLEFVPGWGGGAKVACGMGFTAIQAWLRLAAEVLARDAPTVKLINATEGGASVHGFEERSLAAVLAELPEHVISSRDIEARAHRVSPPLGREAIVSWSERQRTLLRQLRGASRATHRFARQARRAMRRQSAAEVASCFSRLETSEGVLRQSVRETRLIEAWSSSALQDILESLHSAELKDAQDSADAMLGRELELTTILEAAAGELDEELRALALRVRRPTTTNQEGS